MFLLQTLERANTACETISQRAWGAKIFATFRLHQRVYHDVRLVSKVADADTFCKRGAIAYDDRRA